MHRRALASTLVLLVGCPLDDDDDDFAHLGEAWPTSDLGITPVAHDGNFVASDDDQVCYELGRVLGWEMAAEMKGFKVDPPATTTRAATTITVEQPSLGFTTTPGHQLVGLIVKGADAFNVYDYRDSAIVEDWHLHAPYKNGHIPAISHYNVCVEPAPPDPIGEQGCTPGYWRNHLDRWLGAAPSDSFDATFGVDAFDSNVTLGAAISLGGGGVHALARHATAALLNARGGIANIDDGASVLYPLTAQRVIKLVRTAVANGTVDETAQLFDTYNNLGFPLHGTPATP